jgi:acyl-CoA thioester hydrolase
MTEHAHVYPVVIDVPVAWGDMDAFQHVNNVMYLRWCESARIAYFERMGFLARMQDDGVGPILARLTIDYRSPVTFPDVVRVETGVTRVGRSSFHMGYRIVSTTQGVEVAGGDSVLVVFDYRTNRTAPVDAKIRAAIEAVEGKAVG